MSEYGRVNYDVEVGAHDMTEPLTEYAKTNTCRHGVVASRCEECVDIQRVEQENVRRKEALQSFKAGAQPCFHGIIGTCVQCQQIVERRRATQAGTIDKRAIAKQYIVSLLKIITDMVEEL